MSHSQAWQPKATITALRRRAETLRSIRQYFAEQGLLEVDVPVIGSHGVTDPSLIPICAKVNRREGYLQTSPEYFLKRLLAADYGSMYYLGKAFRDQEFGPRHQPEFTLLEWYRLGFDDCQLATDTLALMTRLLPDKPQRQTTYRDLFEAEFGFNPHSAEADQLAEVAQLRCQPSFTQASRDTWLDLLFSHCLEPKLQGVVVVSDYPSSQAALARCAFDEDKNWIARRFEVFVDGLEVGNGYWELTDVSELQRRFAEDARTRHKQGLAVIAPDPQLIAAQRHGLPPCAGIAMGVDRIVMAQLGVESIAQTLAFTPMTHP